MYGLGLDGYDPDSQHDAAVAFRIRVVAQEQYIPLHQHRKGQLIMALGGAITCEVENAMLMVPPQYAVWIPGQTPHSNKATPGAQLCLLFIEPRCARITEAYLYVENIAPGAGAGAGARGQVTGGTASSRYRKAG